MPPRAFNPGDAANRRRRIAGSRRRPSHHQSSTSMAIKSIPSALAISPLSIRQVPCNSCIDARCAHSLTGPIPQQHTLRRLNLRRDGRLNAAGDGRRNPPPSIGHQTADMEASGPHSQTNRLARNRLILNDLRQACSAAIEDGII